jgi:hypothetical protein
MMTLSTATESITLTAPRQRPGGLSADLAQPLGRYSDGRRVVYDKRPAAHYLHNIVLHRVTQAEVDALVSFYLGPAAGRKNSLTWDDGTTQRTVRFAVDRIDYHQAGPDRYAVSFDLEEQIA